MTGVRIRNLKAPDLRRDPALSATWCLLAIHAIAMSWLSIVRYNNFMSGRFDLGNMVQAIWSTTQGRPLESTNSAGEQFNRLGAHVDPILALLAPLWMVIPRPEMLLIVQASAVAVGALPVFWLGRRWLGNDMLAVTGVVVYLLYPPLAWAVLTEFHAVVFAAPLLLFAIWAIDDDRPLILVISVVLALMCKEHVGLAVAMLGVWAWASQGKRRWGTALVVGGLGWTALCLTVIIPYFTPAEGANPFSGRYAHLGGVGNIPHLALTEPWTLIRTVFTEPKVLYLIALLFPLLFLPFRAPLLALGAAPELAINLLTDYWPQFSIQFQYTAVATPFLIAAAVKGLGAIRDTWTPPRWADPSPTVWAGALVVAVLLAGWRGGPLPFWSHVPGGSDGRRWEYRSDPRTPTMVRALDEIPDGVPVSASNTFGARLSDRRYIYSFPVIRDAEWIILDDQRPFIADQMVHPTSFRSYRLAVDRDPHFREVFNENGVHVYQRVVPPITPPVTAP